MLWPILVLVWKEDIKKILNTPLGPLLKRYFSMGLITLLPTAAALWVILWTYRWLEHWARFVFPLQSLQPWIQSLIGIIIVLFAITLLGILTTNVVGKWFLRLMDLFMEQVPLANTVYGFVKSLIENLGTLRAGNFQKVVLIEYPRIGVWSVGFISRELTGKIQETVSGQKVAVFIPTSPNPTSGFIAVVGKDDIISLDITPEEALKFIMSGGVLMPDAAKETGA
jgi:uncharacterized membrane protein